MQFLSWGDYSIPFEWATYWAKHFYMWSFQSGTPNPDGLIRLPGRILNFLVFGATGNVGLGYFYIISSLAVAFIAFFFFARKFLQVKRTSVQVIGALFFALNPIFLGNVAKVGLVLAAAMLPLCLLAIRATFVHKKFRFLLLYVACINLSFLHPYTLTVNLAISGMYAAWMAWQHRAWVRDTWYKFILIGMFALAANMYFILPMLSVGTVSKDVISTNITPVAVDYTALVGVSNTGDLFTGFSLSKNVFVDFAFYGGAYQNVYFFGVFLFYVILFGLYMYTERKLSLTDKRRLGIFFGGFLVLLALAATTVAHIDKLITFLISIPGGWAFRSPLKWQLYIPLVLFGILVILLNRLTGRGRLVLAQAGLLLTFVIMNAYLAADMYQKILTPRSPVYFAKLLTTNMDDKTVLFVNNGRCMDFMRANPSLTTELNQIFGSKNTQVKHVLEDSTAAVNLGGYDYVLGCFDQLAPTLTQAYPFKQVDQFANNTFHLYANQRPWPAVAAADTIYALDAPQNMSSKYQFVEDVLRRQFQFVSDAKMPATQLADAFERLTPQAVGEGSLSATIAADQQQSTQIVARNADRLYYGLVNNHLTLSPTERMGLGKAPSLPIRLTSSKTYDITYLDEKIHQTNIVHNGSLEGGLWQPGVTDCYAYDDKPAIGMRLTTTDKTDGKQALELTAQRHIACTGPLDIPVVQGHHYLLSFDYQSPDGGKYAGYYVSFDDTGQSARSERMQNKDGAWHSFSTEVAAPMGATRMHVLLYAFPDSYGEKRRHARYDRLSAVEIPPAKDQLYLISQPPQRFAKPRNISYHIDNPTRKTVHISGATESFYLTTNDTYHTQWQATLLGPSKHLMLPFARRTAIPSSEHFQLDGTMNGWLVNPARLCARGSGCTKSADGSYSFSLSLEFVPQRWFYLGATVSALAVMAGTAYYLIDRRRHADSEEGKWQWRK